ncbi:MAG: hypothetical protein IJN76_01765 [Clostridia bacterium]|nr:hypothetical protein [Clostridia bacterium]
MDFVCGLIGGALAVALAYCLWPTQTPSRQPRRRSHETPQQGWQDTRNFLYYDGTVMPTKEDNHE